MPYRIARYGILHSITFNFDVCSLDDFSISKSISDLSDHKKIAAEQNFSKFRQRQSIARHSKRTNAFFDNSYATKNLVIRWTDMNRDKVVRLKNNFQIENTEMRSKIDQKIEILL